MECEVWTVTYELWSLNFEVFRISLYEPPHDKTNKMAWMPRLIWVFAERTATLLVLSWGGSYIFNHFRKLGSVKCELWSMNCELWSVTYELWTMKSPPVFRSFVLNSLWTFVKDIWQDKRLQNPWLRLPKCSWSKLFEPYIFFFFFFFFFLVKCKHRK